MSVTAGTSAAPERDGRMLQVQEGAGHMLQVQEGVGHMLQVQEGVGHMLQVQERGGAHAPGTGGGGAHGVRSRHNVTTLMNTLHMHTEELLSHAT